MTHDAAVGENLTEGKKSDYEKSEVGRNGKRVERDQGNRPGHRIRADA